VVAAVAIGALAGPSLASVTWASGADLHIHLDRVTHGAAGTVVVLQQVEVPNEVQGHECEAVYAGENNSSVHPGTDLIITSGGETVELSDVEDAPGAVTSSTDTIIIGSTVTVSVRLGNDGISSLGATLDLTCVPPVPETTTPASTTPATAVSTATTDAAATTIVAVAPTSLPAEAPTTTALTASAGPTTAAPPAAGSGPTLPATGTDTAARLAILAGVLLTVGLAAITARRATSPLR